MFLPPPLIVSFPGGTNKFLSFYSWSRFLKY
jgi:hypothetical protein